MTKSKLCFTMAMTLMGLALVSSNAFAQGRQSAAPVLSHKVGLIDIEDVFNNYEKFKTLQEGLKQEMQESGAQIQNMVQKLKLGEQKLQDPTLKKGSEAYNKLEADLIKHKAALDADVKNKERDFMRRRAAIFKTIHGEVQDMVEAYAQQKQYTLVMRFRRPKATGDDSDPRAVAMNLNSTVIYHRGADDITDIITRALNQSYASAPGDTSIRQTGGQRPANPRTRPAQPAANRRPAKQ